VKVSELARLTGYSDERIRQLADAGEIPGLRVIQRARYQIRRFHDCPALRQWIARAVSQKGKHGRIRQGLDGAAQPLTERQIRKRVTASDTAAQETALSAVEHGKKALEIAAQCGEFLLIAKRQIPHGEWGDWLRKYCPKLSIQTANRYMRLANPTHVSDLDAMGTLKQAYRVTGVLRARLPNRHHDADSAHM
jgi:hypothetical protein